MILADVYARRVATVGMELTFLPLSTGDGEVNRFLGLYQPAAMVQRLRGSAADRLAIRRNSILGT